MKMHKFAATLAVASLLAVSWSAQARIGGSSFSSGGSRSSYSAGASSISSKSYSAPAAPAASSRLGGGGSVGMSRPEVVTQARQQSSGATVKSYGNVGAAPASPSYSAPSTYGASGYSAPAPQRNGYSGTQVAGAALAGAAVGALANSAMHNNGPVVVNNGGGYGGYGGYGGNAVPVGGYGQTTVVEPMNPVIVHSGVSAIGVLFALLVIGGLAYFVYRLMTGANRDSTFYSPSTTSGSTTMDSTEAQDLAQARQLLAQAKLMFRDLQDINNRGDKSALARLTTEEVYGAFAQDIDNRAAPSQTQVVSLTVVGEQVMNFTREANRYLGSLHFQGVVNEGAGCPNERIDEVWHFTKDLAGGPWKLAGIEQV